jgi:hypothetical protein
MYCAAFGFRLLRLLRCDLSHAAKLSRRRRRFYAWKRTNLACQSHRYYQRCEDLALAQLLEPTGVEMSQLVIVEAEQMENCGVLVLERVRDFDGCLAEFVRRFDDLARSLAAAWAVSKSLRRYAILLTNSQPSRCFRHLSITPEIRRACDSCSGGVCWLQNYS